MAKKYIERQAVVVVHGMGEQRPMDTLRSFVNGVKSELELRHPKTEPFSTVRSKPDSIGDIYETTRLSMDQVWHRPKTDFYEFYWAHNMRGTKFSEMTTWLGQVIFRRVSGLPPRLHKIWYTVWGLILAVLLVGGYFTFSLAGKAWLKGVATLVAAGAIPYIFSFIGTFLKSSILNSLGDVTRYFTPEPDNIKERSNIRHQGIEFLKKLHEIKDITRVDRIIVVAHSLGTVVSYDLLRLLWTTYNEGLNFPDSGPVAQPDLDAVDNFTKGQPPIDAAMLEDFRLAQYACWKEQRALGNQWLVTDFITLGAAVNALDYFMVTNETFDHLKTQRELPVIPPVLDAKDHSIAYHFDFDLLTGAPKIRPKCLHHGAMFGVTRWTNIYFSSDFVGGPIQRFFGNGAKDIELKRSSPWFYPGGHTEYWNKDDANNALGPIVDALLLDHEEDRGKI